MTLDELRAQIDEIDADLLALINHRAQCVVEIGEIKRREHVAVLVQERERQLFARLVERNEGPLSEAMLRHIFQEEFRAQCADTVVWVVSELVGIGEGLRDGSRRPVVPSCSTRIHYQPINLVRRDSGVFQTFSHCKNG